MSLQYIEDAESASTSTSPSPALHVRWLQGDTVVSGHLDGRLRAWSAGNGRLLAEAQAHRYGLTSVSANGDDGRILTSSLDGSVSLWDVSQIPRLAERALAPQPTEQEVEASEMPAVQNDDLVEELRPLASNSSQTSTDPLQVFVAQMHPTASFYTATGLHASLVLASALPDDFGRELFRLEAPFAQERYGVKTKSSFGTSIAFSPNGSFLALGANTGLVALFAVLDSNAPRLVHLQTYPSHSLSIRSLSFSLFSSQEDHLFVAGDDGVISMYDIRSLVNSVDKLNAGMDDAAVKQGIHPGLQNPVGFLKGHRGSIFQVTDSSSSALRRLDGSTSAFFSATSSSSAPTSLLATTSPNDGTVRLWSTREIPRRCVCTISVATATGSSEARSRPSDTSSGPAGSAPPEPEKDMEPAAASSQPAESLSHHTLPTLLSNVGLIGCPSLSWRPLSQRRGSDDPARTSKDTEAARFVTGSMDGKLRWFRAAGTGVDVVE